MARRRTRANGGCHANTHPCERGPDLHTTVLVGRAQHDAHAGEPTRPLRNNDLSPPALSLSLAGDFHLQTYGVSHIPEVRPPVDLIQACNGPAVLIVATDGIWDNWKLEDCIGELLKPEVSACV